MKPITVSFSKEILTGCFQLPSSKSISNRLLIIRFLSGGRVLAENLSEASDTILLDHLLEKIAQNTGDSLSHEMCIDAGDSGTVMRFLTALLAIIPGKYHLTGTPGLIRRPAGELVEALRQMGAQIEYTSQAGFPPLRFGAEKAGGGTVEVESGTSSQFLSALLLTAPKMSNGLTLRVKGIPVSWPYVQMTLSLLQRSGISITQKYGEYRIRPQSFSPGKISVEPDWSSAAFWYEMAALSLQADLVLCGLDKESIQGDSIAAELFLALGVETLADHRGVRLVKIPSRQVPESVQMTGHPDLVLPFATACAILSGRTEIRGIHHLQWKESPRLTSFCSELHKVGVDAAFSESGTLYLPGNQPSDKIAGTFNSWNDHRIVMSLAPLAIPYGSVSITDPEVVGKSYPGFWDELRKAGFHLQL